MMFNLSVPDLYGHSITYRVALGPQQGKKVFSLQTLAPLTSRDSRTSLAKEAGFSLHVQPPGFPGATGSTCTETKSQLDAVSWNIRSGRPSAQ